MLNGYLLIIVIFLLFILVVLKYRGRYRKALMMALFPAIVFIKLSEELLRQGLTEFDSTIYNFIALYISSDLTGIMKIISDFGSAPVLIGIVVFTILLSRKLKNSFWKPIAANLAITYLLSDIFKVIFHRQRPDILRLTEASGFSFPSGHSMVSMSFYGFIIYICFISIKKVWIKYAAVSVLGLLILLIGISRIYLGVHYASDVIAGFSAGFVWLCIFKEMFKGMGHTSFF